MGQADVKFRQGPAVAAAAAYAVAVQQWAAAAVGSMSHRPILLVEVPECGHWGPFSVPASHSCDMSEPRPPTAAEVSTFEQFAKVIFVISFSLL